MFRDGCHGDHLLDIDIDLILTSAGILFMTIGEKHICRKLGREEGLLSHPEKRYLSTERRVYYNTFFLHFFELLYWMGNISDLGKKLREQRK